MNHTRPILRLIDDFKRRRTGMGLLRVQQQESNAPFTLGDLPNEVDFGALNAELMELRQDLHQVACSVLAHVEKYGNVRLIDRVIAVVPAFPHGLVHRIWSGRVRRWQGKIQGSRPICC
jgi:hypothetical protein